MLTNRPREYIQLHRDTTVNSLTVQPVIKSGVVHYEDSPLVKAVKNGYILVVDEADKAPLNVTCILKSLIESSEMVLSDGRRIVPISYYDQATDKTNLIPIHKNYRMIILANRPGFPFLGNDFFAVLGDLLACHPIDNPDPASEIQMLRMYGPNVSEAVLNKLVSAFGSLRHLSDQGLISYPYSTRELVNIVKHLEKFPDDSLPRVLANVSDFDYFAEQSDLKNTFIEVMHKHGIPIGASSFQINLAQPIGLPGVFALKNNLNLKEIPLNSSSITSIVGLHYERLKNLDESHVKVFESEETGSRIQAFSELYRSWTLNSGQQITSDMLVTNESGVDMIHVSGVKPMSVLKMNTKTNQSIELNLTDYFPLAWRAYYPRMKLLPTATGVLVYEEATNELLRVDFDSKQVHKLEKKMLHENLNISQQLIKKAKKHLNRFYSDSNNAFRMTRLEGVDKTNSILLNYQTNTSQFSLLNLGKDIELNFNLEMGPDYKLGINQMIQLSHDSILIAGFNANQLKSYESLTPQELNYYLFNFPCDWSNLSGFEQFSQECKFYSIDGGNILGSPNDLLLAQVQIRNFKANTAEPSNAFKVNFKGYIKID